MKTFIFILFFSLFSFSSFGQTDTNETKQADTAIEIKPVITPPKPVKKRVVVDSLKRRLTDSLAIAGNTAKRDSNVSIISDTGRKINATDTTIAAPKSIIIKRPIDSFYLKLLDNPFFRSKAKPIFLVINERKRTSKDEVFYLLAGLLLFLAFIKLVFSKYFKNIFRLFFQPSFRQKQTREQLQQGNLPSLLLNLFFVFSAAAYVSFLLDFYQLITINFWFVLIYSSLVITTLYFGKYIFISFAGWVFNVKDATDTYIFAISLINKIMGVMLIPFTLVIAFGQPEIKNISITISILLIILLFLYRYRVSYAPVRREIKVSPLHFFFYVLAFEITPLLLIYKTLMLYLNKSL